MKPPARSSHIEQGTLDLLGTAREEAASHFVINLLKTRRRPSAAELVAEAQRFIGPEAAWMLPSVLASLANARGVNQNDRNYCQSLLARTELVDELRHPAAIDHEAASSIDDLIRSSQYYRSSEAFREMVSFMARFRDYSPFNNMLVRVQRPACRFYATRKDWKCRFEAEPKPEALPMIILAPMHPVLLVYDLEDVPNVSLPRELREFSKTFGPVDPEWLARMIENARRYCIRIDYQRLSSTFGGYVTAADEKGWKMKVVVNIQLDTASRLGVLAHELAHVLLGHLGSDHDQWWPARANVLRKAEEVEAEAVAYIVAERLGLKTSSAPYVSRHLTNGQLPEGVSTDLIAKTAGLIERFAREKLPAPKPRPFAKAAKTRV